MDCSKEGINPIISTCRKQKPESLMMLAKRVKQEMVETEPLTFVDVNDNPDDKLEVEGIVRTELLPSRNLPPNYECA